MDDKATMEKSTVSIMVASLTIVKIPRRMKVDGVKNDFCIFIVKSLKMVHEN